MWLLALTGCFDPISNAVLYEDARFAAALPSAGRFRAPATLRGDPAGDALLLDEAGRAAEALDDLLGPMVASGEALQGSSPSDRSEVHRGWDPVPVVLLDDRGSTAWWVRASVLWPEGTDATWTIEVAQGADGPWEVAGTGRHADGPEGELSWDPDVGPLAALGRHGTIDASYRPEPGYDRFVEVSHPDLVLDAAGVPLWQIFGEAGMAFTTPELDVGAGGGPGAAVVVHGPDGGRSEGWSFPSPGAVVRFTECWDGHGDRVWFGGDPPIVEEGDAEACAVGPLL